MEAKLLNYPDALKLASLLSKYLDTVSEIKQEPLEFVSDILDKIDPLDYFFCIRLLSPTEINGQEGGKYLLDIFFSGMEKNKIITLVKYYHDQGFT